MNSNMILSVEEAERGEYIRKTGTINGYRLTIGIQVNKSNINNKVFNEFMKHKYTPIMEAISHLLNNSPMFGRYTSARDTIECSTIYKTMLSELCNWEFRRKPFYNGSYDYEIKVWDKRQDTEMHTPIIVLNLFDIKPIR